MVKKILSSGMKPNAKDLQRLIFFMKTHYDNGKKKSRHSASGHAYKGISDTLRRKDGHTEIIYVEKRVNQEARTMLGG